MELYGSSNLLKSWWFRIDYLTVTVGQPEVNCCVEKQGQDKTRQDKTRQEILEAGQYNAGGQGRHT